MPFITMDLLRRRSEHHEGCPSECEEIMLHQQDIEKIEVVGDVCRDLQILHLQNNLIPRIENLHKLKKLWYLNLAINSIEVIENLEGLECLKRLDLTLNFIKDLTSIERLRVNQNLESLHLTGNGCTSIEGYRYYVVDILPQLSQLDSQDITKSERIRAKQEAIPVREDVARQRKKVEEEEAAERAEKERRQELGLPDPPRAKNEKGEELYGHSPAERMAVYRDMQEQVRKSEEKPPNPYASAMEPAIAVVSTPEEEIAKYGRVLQRNQAKLDYTLVEEGNLLILRVMVPKFISTSLVNVDLQPTYVRITIKGQVLQLVFPHDVTPDKAKVERAAVNGELCLKMPISDLMVTSAATKPRSDAKSKPASSKAPPADTPPAPPVNYLP